MCVCVRVYSDNIISRSEAAMIDRRVQKDVASEFSLITTIMSRRPTGARRYLALPALASHLTAWRPFQHEMEHMIEKPLSIVETQWNGILNSTCSLKLQ